MKTTDNPETYTIELANEQDSLDIDEARIREVAAHVLNEEHVATAEISIAIVDNPTMRALNVQHLAHDYDTDVLSFLLECEQESAGSDPDADTCRGRGKRIEGELIVSGEMAIEMAKKYRWNPHDELVLYVVHGLLHLVGFDDLTESEKRQMRSRERQLLKHWGLTPRYDDDAPPGQPQDSTITGDDE
ncbi:MAG: rRNA maturation RNase YbeY [Planctomycetota bacterium]|nr:rRNA maturation RNase YbeY [Planctomycetota bacterium]